MKAPGSLRTRIIFGALIWTGGLLAVVHLISTGVVLVHYEGTHSVQWLLHGFMLMVGAVVALLIGLAQVKRALAPFDELRARLGRVRLGQASQVAGQYPVEVQPVVNDLNALLDHRERTVKRAIDAAGDLAHGLKTPLAILAHDADRAGAAGQTELAASLRQQIDKMQRQIDWHLARARAAASGGASGARCSVGESVDGLVRTVQKLYGTRALSIGVSVPADSAVAVQREDLDEMLGNLLDNACKWAGSRVQVAAEGAGDHVVVSVEDDGPGIPSEMRTTMLERGTRADEAAPGSGLGLAIVRDLAEVYGGSITLDTSAMGGLRAELTLPSAPIA